MDDTTLRMRVEQAVKDNLDAMIPFTTVDISHPLIKEDADVRHWQVRQVVNEMEARGEMQAADFESSNITVYPEGPGKPSAIARLWHPIGYDPSDYKGGHKVLIRNQAPATAASTPAFVSVKRPAQPPVVPGVAVAPGVVSKMGKIQSRNNTFSIPTKVVRAAGLKPNDYVRVNTNPIRSDCTISITRADAGKGLQRVDKEGRIRLHGARAKLIRGQANVWATKDNGNDVIKVW